MMLPLSLLFLSACTPPMNQDTSDNTPSTTENTDQKPFSQTADPVAGDTMATIKTSMGDIVIRLFPDIVPKTVENFTTHAKNGYYDGLIFHRVIDNFMIQGGDPRGNGTGGESIWGGTFDDEFSDKLSNIKGSIAMANSGPNTNGSQFFINEVDNTYLDFNKEPLTSKHDVFGQVVEGMDVLNAIAKVPVGQGSKPLQDVTIETIEIWTHE